MGRKTRQRRCVGLATIAFLVLGAAATAKPLSADAAAACAGSLPGIWWTQFITCSGAGEVYGSTAVEALVSDASVSLPNSATDHVLEYVDLVVQGTCGLGTNPQCWTQAGWMFGTIDTHSSGAYQRPYGEYNDTTTGLQPTVNVLTTTPIHCCSMTDYNDISTSWTGITVGGVSTYRSYFNNLAGSGNITLATAHLPAGKARADVSGEEGAPPGTVLPTVSPVGFAGVQLQLTVGTWIPWSPSSEPGEENQPSNGDYPFLEKSDFSSFTYEGP
jgi:hypothetical protein